MYCLAPGWPYFMCFQLTVTQVTILETSDLWTDICSTRPKMSNTHSSDEIVFSSSEYGEGTKTIECVEIPSINKTYPFLCPLRSRQKNNICHHRLITNNMARMPRRWAFEYQPQSPPTPQENLTWWQWGRRPITLDNITKGCLNLYLGRKKYPKRAFLHYHIPTIFWNRHFCADLRRALVCFYVKGKSALLCRFPTPTKALCNC